MLRERLGEHGAERETREHFGECEIGDHCSERVIEGTLCCERDCGNTVLRERLWNTVLRERLGEQCVERESWELCAESDWRNTVLRERLVEHCAEREIWGTLC